MTNGKRMKATDAIKAGKLPEIPQLTGELLQLLHELINNNSCKRLSEPFNKIHQGKYFRFIEPSRGVWFLLDDDFDEEPSITLENSGEFYQCDPTDEDSRYKFLTWVFKNGNWVIEAQIHANVDEESFDNTTREEISEGIGRRSFAKMMER
jgi:hypothetical protein